MLSGGPVPEVPRIPSQGLPLDVYSGTQKARDLTGRNPGMTPKHAKCMRNMTIWREGLAICTVYHTVLGELGLPSEQVLNNQYFST